MKMLRNLVVLAPVLFGGPVLAQTGQGTSPLSIAKGGTKCSAASGTCLDNITGFSSTGYMQRTGAGTYTFSASVPASSVTVGTTSVVSGTSTRVLFDNAGIVGEYPITGTGNVALSASPTFTGTLTAAAINSAAHTITSASATALTVGPNGTTNPVLTIVGSVASQADGLNLTGTASGNGVALQTSSPATNSLLTLNSKGTGGLFLQNSATGAISLGTATTLSGALTYGGVTLNNAVTGTGNMVLSASPTLTGTLTAATISSSAHTVTSPSASAFAVGLNGTTNPALQVDASTALQATGLKVTGFAAAGGVGLSAISSGANEPIAINAKGSSAIGIGNVSTGGVQLAAGGGGVTINGNLTFSPTTAGPLGTTTNDNASTGVVGEYVESVIASGSAVALTTATPKTVTSITLSAGDWDIDTLAYFANGATTSFTLISGSISGTTNVLDSTAGKINTLVMNPTIFGGVACSVVIAPYRLSLSGSTTVFLVVQASFTVSTASGFGIIRARRAR